ncbi:aminotransferase class I/II-fold pyridoxal phosphate-dependent enzyme [Thalassospiraceae bacterium LMO-JJ14]|nr:aminotransferase class I/II-fold pyridoxal phosphate-dependent enzyme [Thalassospiraceae bacterium LMO-JJ14]
MPDAREHDRFGNPFADGLSYARGDILPGTADDIEKLKTAWAHIRRRRADLGEKSVYLLSGLERNLQLDEVDLSVMDDEIASALFTDDVTTLGLKHLGGDPARHDVFVFNRLTAALLTAADVMIKPGDAVIGVSPRYSHPAVRRAVAHGGGSFTDTAGIGAFRDTMDAHEKVDVVFITRLSVSYEILPEADLKEIVRLAQAKGARIIVDDAGGARVGPACFGQPKLLELGVDVGATGMDKYGTTGPRLGLLGGSRELVAKIRARAYEMGVEARQMLYPAVVQSLRDYSPDKVRERVALTKEVGRHLKQRLGGNRVMETPVIVQLTADDILEMAMERGGIIAAPCVPYEATAGLAMIMLRDFGIVSVHFAGLPPGTAALMIKFLPPETVAEFGGPQKLSDAIDESLTRLADVMKTDGGLQKLILGSA